MSDKQKLISTLIENLQRAKVELPDDMTFRAEKDIWEKHPDGYYNPCTSRSVEGALSCFTEQMLNKCLKVDIPEHIPYTELLLRWNRFGVLQDEPSILYIKGFPVLRIRHDLYLHAVDDYGFTLCCDAYESDHCRSSSMDMNGVTYLTHVTPHVNTTDACTKIEASSLTDYAFKWLLILRYPFEICGVEKDFHRILRRYPDLFSSFMTEVVSCNKGFEKAEALDLVKLKTNISKEKFNSDIKFSIVLTCEQVSKFGGISRKAFARLDYSNTAVHMQWNGDPGTCAVRIPKWNRVAYKAYREEVQITIQVKGNICIIVGTACL